MWRISVWHIFSETGADSFRFIFLQWATFGFSTHHAQEFDLFTDILYLWQKYHDRQWGLFTSLVRFFVCQCYTWAQKEDLPSEEGEAMHDPVRPKGVLGAGVSTGEKILPPESGVDRIKKFSTWDKIIPVFVNIHMQSRTSMVVIVLCILLRPSQSTT